MPRRLIVIYNRLTGKVLKTVQGGLITQRRQLLNHVQNEPLNTLAFYYEEEGADIDKQNDTVRKLVHGQPPTLCDIHGKPKLFELFIRNRKQAIANSTHLKVDFEGGMGDQVMELEAVKELRKQRPDLRITIGIHSNYWNIAPFLEHHGDYAHHGRPSTHNRGYYYVTNRTEYITDPRGGYYGKASLYGASIGLDRVKEKIRFEMPYPEILLWAKRGNVEIDQRRRPILGIHIRSGSGGAKSWNTEPAQVLAAIWHTKTGGDVFLCGDPANFSLREPWAFTLPNRCDWASVGAVILTLSLLVCIDSGPMHLARSASIPSVVLWGGTGPKDILGRDKTETDLRANIDCIENICYSCPRGDSLCMRAITPQHVWEVIEKIFPQLLKDASERSELKIVGGIGGNYEHQKNILQTTP